LTLPDLEIGHRVGGVDRKPVLLGEGADTVGRPVEVERERVDGFPGGPSGEG